ncbi:unnamed protein product [Arctogadus glacialis]
MPDILTASTPVQFILDKTSHRNTSDRNLRARTTPTTFITTHHPDHHPPQPILQALIPFLSHHHYHLNIHPSHQNRVAVISSSLRSGCLQESQEEVTGGKGGPSALWRRNETGTFCSFNNNTAGTSVPLDRRAPISIALMKGPHVLHEKHQDRSHDSSERTRLIGCLMYNSG